MRRALTEIRISRSALNHNVEAFRRVIGSRVKLMVVVKSNAYGHGVGECAPVFARAGADWFGVASLLEALQLRHIVRSKPILVLSYVDGGATDIRKAIQQGIRLPAYTLAQLRLYQHLAHHGKRKALVHVKFDTGTSRIGFLPRELPALVRQLRHLPQVQFEGAFSHFAEVEAKQQAFTQQQLDRFAILTAQLEIALGRSILKHIDCSAGVLLEPAAHFGMVRVGMSAYGIHTAQDLPGLKHQYPAFSLRPALTMMTTIVQVKRVPKGTNIGYNRTYTCTRPTTLAILPIGYGDGLDRKLSNVGYFLINGKTAPIRGRVCMNLTMVDITNIPSVRAGNEVTVIGCSGRVCVSAETLAEQIGTIPYEVLTRLNPLILRCVAP